VRVNGARGHGAQSSLVAMDKLDAVELQAGAGSAQYGSDAMGGVINIITPVGVGKPRFDAYAEGGSFGTYGGGFSASGGSERVQYSISGSRMQR
jgi:outer membrane cobalamin receptor